MPTGGRWPSCSALQLPGLFVGRIPRDTPYLLSVRWGDAEQQTEDPYSFPLLLGEMDLHLIAEGTHRELWTLPRRAADEPRRRRRRALRGVGAQCPTRLRGRRLQRLGRPAPPDAHAHRSRRLGAVRSADASAATLYKYEILGPHGTAAAEGRSGGASQAEPPPRTASVVRGAAAVRLDRCGMDGRGAPTRHRRMRRCRSTRCTPAPGGARWTTGNRLPRPGDELADRLIPYVSELGFTHIELMPVTEHPFGGSWGYQPLSQFAPTPRSARRRNSPRFVDRCHAAGIGVILDWVPAHFPTDAHGLAHFDGTALYEHADPREGLSPGLEHADLQPRPHTRCATSSSPARCTGWSDITSTACASTRWPRCSTATTRARPGEWVPNRHGGRENLEAVAFLRHLNEVVRSAESRRADHRRGVDRLARRHAADARGRPGLLATNGTWAGCTTRWRYIAQRPGLPRAITTTS